MQEDKLLPHLENLVPGCVALLLIAAVIPPEVLNPDLYPGVVKLFQDPVVRPIIVLAAAYTIGVVVFTLSRLVVDFLSEWTFRWVLLALFDSKTFVGPRIVGWPLLDSPSNINSEYRKTLRAALDHKAPPLLRREVIKRRERGRLVRTALLPAVWIGSSWDGSGAIFGGLMIVFLYAYTEVAIYKEAKLAADHRT